MTNANPFYVHPAGDYAPQLMGLAGQISDVGERRALEQEKSEAEQRLEAMKQGALKAYQSGDPNKMAEFSIKNPEFGEILSRVMKFKSPETKENYMQTAFQALANPDQALEVAQSRRDFLIEQGLKPEEMRDTNLFISQYQQDPEQAMKNLEMSFASMATKEMWERYKGIKGVTTDKDETEDIQNFKHYQSLIKSNPEQASSFARQVGITQKAEDKTTAIKEFEYGEKNPKFKLSQQDKEDNKKTKEVAGKTFESATKLRKEFLGQSDEYKKVRDAYTRVVGSTKDPSPAGDLSLIFNYMKMLDPGSVVRESEFATAASAGSYGERIQASVQKVLSGERLSPNMRADFVKKSGTLMKGMEDQHLKRVDNYRSIAEKNKLPVDEVVVDITAPEEETEPGPQYTEEDIQFTMQKHGLTREQVLERIK